MKLLSIQAILKGAWQVIQRFPFAMLACLVGTVLGITFIHIDDPEPYVNLMLTMTFAAPLFVGAVLFSGAMKFSQKYHWAIHGVIAAFLLGYYFLLPDPGVGVSEYYIRHTMWAIGFVLLVTFIPFAYQHGPAAIRRFWQYNRGLVFALVLTGIWAGALQAGLSIALASVDFLFEIRIDEERYAEIWIVLVGIFSPLFFLSRLPKKPHALDTKQPYPKEVRLFSQFVLVPLVTLYFLILYAYTARILITTTWPEGQLAWMILGFSFLGVLTYLALYPLREKVNWVRHFGTGLFVAMIPQTGMLFWALSFRIRDYGITENRYFVLIFGFWLMAIAIYFLLRRVKDIRLIPATIFLIAVVTSVGPWGAFEVAERSQINRLEGILVENGLLQDGLYVPASAELSKDDVLQINEIVRYLSRHHGLDGIEPWFGGEDFDELGGNNWDRAEIVITEKFGVEEAYFYGRRFEPYEEGYETFAMFLAPFDSAVLPVGGYDYMMDVAYGEFGVKTKFMIDEQEYQIKLDESKLVLELVRGDELLATIDFSEKVDQAKGFGREEFAREDTIVTVENDQVKLLFSIESLFGEVDDGEAEIHTFMGLMLLTIK